jgi:hypothetical protein
LKDLILLKNYWGQTFKIRLTVLNGQRGKETGYYFGIKGPAVRGAIKGIEGRLKKQIKSRKE